MKIILTVAAPHLDSQVDTRFGRCAYFLIADPDTLEWQAFPNPGVNTSGGAGSLAAQFIASQNADAVISGDFGPNAYNALAAIGIPMYLYGSSTMTQDAIQRFKAGQLQRVSAPTGPGLHAHRS